MMELLLKSLLAALITLFIERTPKIYEAWNIRRHHFALLGDNWKSFHYSFKKNKPVLIESKWKITKGTLYPFNVTFEQPGLCYKGHLVFEGDDRIILFGKSKTQNETVVYRFPNPLPSNGDSVVKL